MQIKQDREQLLKWYHQNKRPLPWRKNRDPYLIWISEVMLQQTTVAAVIPYFERFTQKFPNVKTLAKATLPQVYEQWAGLGYYSRARNLHKAAQLVANQLNGHFPKTTTQLIELPGFGPYTSRAVASLAFNEKVGVLDGNVIRVLSRRYGLSVPWWNTKERQHLQNLSDQMAQTEKNADLNQALMELGATVCTPKKPLCLLCPWKNNCLALSKDQIEKLPLSKPKQEKEIWQLNFKVQQKSKRIFLEPMSATPFLKKEWFPSAKSEKLSAKPKKYAFTHSVTKYNIFVNVQLDHQTKKLNLEGQWIDLNQIKKINPSSLMTKILNFAEKQLH